MHPGEFHFGEEGGYIDTLLGSCIAIILWHRILRVGGMCHFVLPMRNGPEVSRPNARYAVEAMELFRRNIPLSTTIKEYKGMIYGGANIRQEFAGTDAGTIGLRNADFALNLLQRLKIEVVKVDVGKTWARRVSFDIGSGFVEVKPVKSTELET